MSNSPIAELFVTRLYRTQVSGARRLNAELHAACVSIAKEDGAGRAWSKKHAYPGYTSYASLNDLPQRAPPFAALKQILDKHVRQFARAVDFDLAGRDLALDSLWINVLAGGGVHTGHIHPHSVVSGTYYVAVPQGASTIRFEDPRLGLMMSAPPRREKSTIGNRNFVSIEPRAGMLLMWESWLRHEVPLNRARGLRISISFNYGLR